MRQTALARRLERALRNAERDDPDGPLSSYAWMWRALVRSSDSRVGLYLRFARLVVVDALFLLAWRVVRPFRTLARSRLGVAALAGSAAIVVSLLLIGNDAPEYPPAPWTGPLAIEVHGIGLSLGGQRATDEEALFIIRHYGVQRATVELDGETPAARVFEVNDLLHEAGVRRVVTSQTGPAG